jgi:hypothetical protein
MSGTADAILDRLVELDRQVEAHRTAAWLIEHERDELRIKLRLSGWTPPAPKAAP